MPQGPDETQHQPYISFYTKCTSCSVSLLSSEWFFHVFLLILTDEISLPVFFFPFVSYLRIPSSIMMTRFCNLEGYNYHTPSV